MMSLLPSTKLAAILLVWIVLVVLGSFWLANFIPLWVAFVVGTVVVYAPFVAILVFAHWPEQKSGGCPASKESAEPRQ